MRWVGLFVAASLFAAPGASATTMELWLRADLGVTSQDNSGSGGDAGDVSAWADQSGRGSDVSQVTVADMPELVSNGLNGNPVVRFSGEGENPSPSADTEYLAGAIESPVDLNRATVLAVGSFNALNTTAIIDLQAVAGNRGFVPFARGGCGLLGGCTSSGGDLYGHHRDGVGEGSNRLQLLDSFSLDTQHHVFANIVDKQSAEMAIFLDGVDLELPYAGCCSSAQSTAALNDITRVALGPAGNSDFFGGDIAEIMVFDDVLTSDQLTGMTHILGERWGLTVPTASAFQIASANSLLPAIVPEPNTALLMGVGLTGLAMKRRRTRRGC